MFTKALFANLVVTLLAFTNAASAQPQSAREKDLGALVEMERAFAKAAATKGTRDAFIEFLANDGVIFQPGPVNGRKFWSERQPRKGLLSWEPVFADVSMAGDLGYTTGPWEFRPNGPADTPTAFGQYFTIWKRQTDGSWKAVLDRGVTFEKPFDKPTLSYPAAGQAKVEKNFDVIKGRAMLLALEEEFSRSSAVSARTAFSGYLADHGWILRPNSKPAIGKSEAGALLPESGRALTWKAALADISRSGDLGYTFGAFELISRGVTLQHGSYVRMWKKINGKWKVVADIMSPDPQ